MKKPKIVFVGGGSYAWVPNLVKDMMYHPALGQSEVVLYDINIQAAEFCKQFIDAIQERIGTGINVIATDDRHAAFKDADYVLITIAVGGLDAMQQDLAIPEEFGIYHTVGDTSGPGGWIRAIRHFETFKDIAESLKEISPKAMVLNYTNPMAMLTDILSRLHPGPVVGLCHGVFDNINFIRDTYKLESRDDVNVHYGGINHFIWFTRAWAGPVNVIEDLKQELQTKTLDDIKHGEHADAMGFTSQSAIATELFRMTGIMPFLGDRHTCEFFSRYITDPKVMKHYHLKRTSIADRRNKRSKQLEKFKSWLDSEIPDHVFNHSQEKAANIIDAHFTGTPFVDVGNVPNIGQIQNLPLGAVVETAVRYDRCGVTPITFGPLPEVVKGMITPWTTVYKLLVDACFSGDKNLAFEALHLDLCCAQLSNKAISELGKKLLVQNKEFIKCF